MSVNQKGGKSCDRAEGVAVWETDDMMSECEKKKKSQLFWQPFGGRRVVGLEQWQSESAG